MTYYFSISNLYLKCLSNRKTIISDSVEYHRAKFIFDENWLGYTKSVTFNNTKSKVSKLVSVLDIEDSCDIPWEVLADDGYLTVCVQGINGDSSMVTKMPNPLLIEASDKTNGSVPLPPTPSVYDQIITQLSDKADGLKYVGTKLSLLSGEKELSCVNINGEGSGKTSNYNSLENKPSVNGIELIGNKTTEELGLNVDLSNYATKEETPTKTSELANDSNFVEDINYIHTDNNFTDVYKNKVDSALQEVPSEYVTEAELENKGYIAEYIETDPTVPTYVKEITQDDILNWDNKSNFSGSYNDLTDKPNIPSKTSDLTNDSNFTTNTYVDNAIGGAMNGSY